MNNKFKEEIPDWLKFEFSRYAFSVMPELSIAEINGFIENAWYVKISGGSRYQIDILSRDTWSQEINGDVYLYSMYEEISVDAPDATGWISPRGEEIPGSEITFLEWRDSKKTFSFIQPSNEIWYKTISGEPLTPSSPGSLPEIIFNENGIMRFASPLTGITISGSSVFYGCSDLLEISLPGSLLVIKSLFGGNCPNLKKLIINNGTTTIDSYSLNQLQSLEEVEIKGETLIKISSGVFQNDISLKKINIPDSVTKIESYAFQYCSSLENLELPKNLTTIYDNAFSYSSVKFDNGILILPDSVETVNNNAFYYTTGIKKFIVNPESSLTSLGSYAFNGSNLEEIEILKDLNLPSNNFCFGSKLKKVTIKAKNIPSSYLGYQPDLESITLIGTETIESGAFSNSYYNLKTVVFPDGLVSFGNNCFASCGIFPIKLPRSVKTIGASAFANPSGQGKRVIILNEGLEEIGAAAFLGSKIDTITIPSTVKTIGTSSFSNSGATRIEIKGIPEEIASGCFSGTNEIKSSDFVCSESLEAKENNYWGAKVYTEELPGGIFINSNQVISVKNPEKISGDIILPDTITEINSNAFSGCFKITSISGAGVTTIGDSSFYNCSELSEIDFPEITHFGNYSLYKTSIKSITFGENVETIGNSVLSGSPVKQITIESGDTVINSGSFTGLYLSESGISYPTEMTGYPWGATIVEITEDGLMIKNGVLYGYQGDSPLVTLNIPETVTSINYSTVGINVPTLKKVIFNSTISIGSSSSFQNLPGLKEIEGIEIVRGSIGFASFSGSGCQVTDEFGNYILCDTWLTGMTKSGELIVPDGVEDFCSSQFFNYSGSFPSEITIRIPDSVKALRNNTFGIEELCSSSSRTFNVYIGSGVETIESTPLPKSTSSKTTITLNVYTSNQTVKDFLATYGNSYTIVNIYEPNIN